MFNSVTYPAAPRAALLLPLLALAAGCPRDEERSPAPATTSATITVKDDLGRAVSLAAPARRIASLSPSNTEILFALGCGGAVVLRDRVSTYPPEVKELPQTSPFHLSADHVAGFSPELVLLSHADAARVEALRRVGLAVASFDPRTLADVYRSILAIGTLCGARQRAEALVARMKRQVARVSARVAGRPRPRVYVETDGSDPLKPWTAGGPSFVTHLLELAGGRNIFAGLERAFVQVNAEQVLAARPQVIVVMGVAGNLLGKGRELLRERAGGWSELAAVREGRVVDTIHPDLISRPGPRLARGLSALARAIHPEAFR